uniref:Tyrosine-protein phosphatase domain-containing protein n=1 Tax=Parascaris equorum TaxID=6256 RepID=A0A914RT40_PAREQ
MNTFSKFKREIIFSALKRGLKPDLKRYVKEIRSQRSQVIQAEEQYVYIHFAVAQFLWLKNVVSAQDIKGTLNVAHLKTSYYFKNEVVEDIEFFLLQDVYPQAAAVRTLQ